MIIDLPSLKDTEQLATTLAPSLRAGGAVLLQGDLGVGKTSFARAVLQALGVEGEVPSPTFTLVQSYEISGLHVFHFDLYRLKHPYEVEEIGFDDALADGLVFVEWPEKASAYMPQDALILNFVLDDAGHRQVSIKAPKSWQDRLGSFYVGK